jgi:hypothetical protein
MQEVFILHLYWISSCEFSHSAKHVKNNMYRCLQMVKIVISIHAKVSKDISYFFYLVKLKYFCLLVANGNPKIFLLWIFI